MSISLLSGDVVLPKLRKDRSRLALAYARGHFWGQKEEKYTQKCFLLQMRYGISCQLECSDELVLCA